MSEHVVAQPQRVNAPQEATKGPTWLQGRDIDPPERSFFQEGVFDTSRVTFAEPRFGYDFSRVSALSKKVWQSRPILRKQVSVQRYSKQDNVSPSFCPSCSEAEFEPNSETDEATTETGAPDREAGPAPAPSEPTTRQAQDANTSGDTTSGGLLVEDSAAELSPGQMKKSEFLSRLRREVGRSVESALAGTGRTTEDCPYLVYWFDFYSAKGSAHIERTIHRYAPDASNATTADAYISLIAHRARQAADTWVRTGEVTGLPERVSTALPGGSSTTGKGSGNTATGPVMYKARDGGARSVDDPHAIQAELGEGQPLVGAVRSRMESAFGMNFSHVRTHTDTKAANLSDRLNARAFTVGNNIAFGSSEYQPGKLIGDALIAHELAHVIQQTDGKAAAAHMRTGDTNYDMLEKDADSAAMSAVSTLWSRTQASMANISEAAIPRLRSGLKLQRCQQSSTTSTSTATTSGNTTTSPTVAVGHFRNSGSTSPENQCSNCPRSLGIHTTDFKNGMELRGDITGHIPQAQYDFKRTREGGIWKKVGGSWIQRFHDGPGQNDDATDADEYLTPVNNHIYVEDIPGLGRNPSGGDASATEAVLKGSFVEWVNVRVGTSAWTKRSNEFEWHSISWVEKVGGNWRRKVGKNEIGTGSTTVGTGNP